MADGTLSMAEGLGLKALDSNELRRKLIPNLQNLKSSIQHGLEVSSPKISGNPQIISTQSIDPTSSSHLVCEPVNLQSIKTHSPSRKLQQVFFEERLIMEAEQRAILVQGNNQFTRQSTEVHNSNPKTLYNARGNPYVEGDPNLGYSPRSLQPRYSQPLLNVVPNPNITHPLELASVRANPDKGSTISPSRQPFIKTNSQPFT